jgi:hypothetical protein
MYLVALKVGADGSTNRRKEFFFAESGEKAKSLEFVFYGIFELSEAQLNSDVKQRLVYVGERIGSGYVYAGDWLRRDHHPAYRRRRFRHCIQNAFFEELSICEE